MGSAVKLLLAVYRLQQGQTLKLRGFCASSKLCPRRSSPIAAEPTRTNGVLMPKIESDCATVSSTQALLLQRRISDKML